MHFLVVGRGWTGKKVFNNLFLFGTSEEAPDDIFFLFSK